MLLLLLACVTGRAQTLNLHWAKQIGSTSSDAGFSITTDKPGNVYTAGNFRGHVDLDPGNGTFMVHSFGSDDMFITKLDATGNFVWAKQLGGPDYDNGSAITIDTYGNIYIAGFFQGTSDLDPGPGIFNLSSNGSNDVFIAKLNPSGNFIWAKQVGGASSDMCLSVATDSLGNVYAGGYFIGAVDFDPGTPV
ncbi:MAG: SBBP repeat-containing protein, partial [Bacteroidia bacterium]